MRYGWLRRGLAAGAVAALGALALVLVFPVYFRADDALHLEWASSHPNPLAAFVPAQATVLGVFRPLQSLAWWSLYRLFGLRPEPYQLLVTLLFLACLGLFVRLARRMFSTDAAWWSLGAFLTFFPYLISVVFWFSDLSFLLEGVLMLAAVIFLMEALAGRVCFAWGVGAYLLAVLAKEPVAFIVPAAGAALLLAEWRGLEGGVRRKGAGRGGGPRGNRGGGGLASPLAPRAPGCAARWRVERCQGVCRRAVAALREPVAGGGGRWPGDARAPGCVVEAPPPRWATHARHLGSDRHRGGCRTSSQACSRPRGGGDAGLPARPGGTAAARGGWCGLVYGAVLSGS